MGWAVVRRATHARHTTHTRHNKPRLSLSDRRKSPDVLLFRGGRGELDEAEDECAEQVHGRALFQRRLHEERGKKNEEERKKNEEERRTKGSSAGGDGRARREGRDRQDRQTYGAKPLLELVVALQGGAVAIPAREPAARLEVLHVGDRRGLDACGRQRPTNQPGVSVHACARACAAHDTDVMQPKAPMCAYRRPSWPGTRP